MIKEILGAILISACLNAPQPHKAVGSSTVLSGQYTLKDSYDFTEVQNKWSEYVDNPINLTYSFTIAPTTGRFNEIQMFGYLSGDGDYEMHPIRQIDIMFYKAGNNAHVRVEDRVDDYIELEDIQNNKDINYVEVYGDYNNVIQNLVINFTQENYINGLDAIIFNCIFNKSGNRYVQFYDGYYHYNNTGWYASNYEYSYDGPLFLIKNGIYNSVSHMSSVEYTCLNIEGSTYSTLEVYKNDTYTNVSNININGLLPKYVRDCMNSEGAFQYVNDTEPSTWYEMILSTMDAPLYYLHGLLGFELFGINLFVAFSSLLTLVLIVTVIKKVV